LASNSLYWNGPEFLKKDISEWPPAFEGPKGTNDEIQAEFKKLFSGESNLLAAYKVIDTGDVSKKLDPSQYSVGRLYNGYFILQRHGVIFFKWIYKAIIKRHIPWKSLRDKFLSYLVLKAQRDDEAIIRFLESKTGERKPRVLKSLSPFVDDFGIVRSNSRLANIDHIPYTTRFPILLSKESSLSKLIAASAHREMEHPVGREAAKHMVRKKYIIIRLDSLLREIKTECPWCIRNKAEPCQQEMAALPKYRFGFPLQAFSKTGLDFAGPFMIRQGRGKPRLKSYILVFTCLQTRAIHLEVTHDQSTDSVVNAFSRFIDVRGMPQEFLSDNWKSFISKEKELQEWVRDLDSNLIIRQEYAQIVWHFTPPYGPHHGGIYEIMVKATKRALKNIFIDHDLNMDEFRTAVSRVAALLNSRPLTRVKKEGTNQILTPNHFLIGKLGGSVATKDLKNPVERWRKVCAILNKFWAQFLHEYLPLLTKRTKWQEEKDNIEVNEVVLLIEENVPRGQWKLAIVLEVFPDKKGIVRRCKIKTSLGVYERPITKLCSLEVKAWQ
jgi:hypothetical protein